ncbi:hypothetical protein [Geodermatophilus sp. SYSU D00710]
MGIGTVFNFLGPLTNPARPVAAASGCADVPLAPVVAAVVGHGDRRGAVAPGGRGHCAVGGAGITRRRSPARRRSR